MSRFSTRTPEEFIGHLERYVFALSYIHKKSVLDLGCKDGYGAHLLSCFAKHVTLADRNTNSLALAEKYYRFLCETDSQQVDFEVDFPKGKWDAIVAFEVIEHIANYEQFVQNIADNLPSGGMLIFSVPHMIKNPDHKVLFDEKSILALISKYFILEEFYIQDKLGISGKPAISPPISYVGVAYKL